MLNYALQTQQKILAESAKENELAQKKMDELISQGHSIVMKGKVEGPYTVRNSYYFTDGSFVTLVTPASLHWYSHLFMV